MHEVWIMEEKRPTVTMYSAYQAVKCGIHEPKYDGVQKQVCANTKKREAGKKNENLGQPTRLCSLDRRSICCRTMSLQKTAMSNGAEGMGWTMGQTGKPPPWYPRPYLMTTSASSETVIAVKENLPIINHRKSSARARFFPRDSSDDMALLSSNFARKYLGWIARCSS